MTHAQLSALLRKRTQSAAFQLRMETDPKFAAEIRQSELDWQIMEARCGPMDNGDAPTPN